ncbi:MULTISPECIES: hypothetical protein [unclassified Streptomyces]|uniref:hypothetical protein n=1 Tax=unclassified Streptomyces TaxID=2593676 RepID=UPI001BE753BF|nr:MULTISPECIES: hypothetical protein [unclassified Streptomyces]MBT2408855.1 hypothetical protein [Streptomyces sp. ISL-21]MBT2611662.1 hypothetical protein [Streptomyces sp. ISL-87]
MGLDITVFAVDWDRFEQVPADACMDLFLNDAYPELSYPGAGWQWPRPGLPGEGSLAWYRFRDTLGSFKAHFWAGERWEHIRDTPGVIGSPVRAAVDGLLSGLYWVPPEAAEDESEPPEPSDEQRRRGLMMSFPPSEVAALAAYWDRAEPLVDGLRESFDVHAAVPTGWIRTFPEFESLLRDWGEVVREARRRGWGVIAFPL